MKKIMSVFCAFILISVSLFACGSKSDQSNSVNSESLEWLSGNWYSKDWDITYTFIEDNNTWTIKNENDIIAQNTIIDKENKNKNIILVSPDGTKFIIDKKNDTHFNLQQEAKEGFNGLTNSVEFVKK